MEKSNVAIYVRVSTQEQKLHGVSVDAQEAACRAWVAERRHRLVGVYNDAGLSARTKYKKRREMLHLLEDVRQGRIDLIIFTKLDRWFRNVADYYEVQAILEAADVKWRAIQEDYETETASGRFKVNIMLAVAQDEADRTAERIRTAAAYKRAKGEATGRPALGYRIENRHFVIDPAVKPGVEAFFAAYLRTYSVRAAMLAAREHGIELSATHAGRMLRNTTYCGDAFGVPCPAYITREQFDVIRSNAGKRTRVNKTGRVFLFSGLLRCGYCGGAMTSASAPSGSGDIRYYRCLEHYQRLDACPIGCYVNERKLEQTLLTCLAAVIGHISLRASGPKAKTQKRPDPRQIQGKLDRLKELYIEGDLDRTAYDTRAARLRQELAEAERPPETAPAPAALPAEWTNIYATMSAAGRKLFWRRILREIRCRKDRPPTVCFFDGPSWLDHIP